ncbi:uncharacterized protein LOC125178347 [Hyalella azteca]|uniref:Uncharacterized protein LOC125178347 n=1 Tax=Hyalella azteca TaxID=294128 RepID=A0A979FLC5_HYAAZ|nr:uncharacterized protein LOC125178347 [Hyalella azteca]
MCEEELFKYQYKMYNILKSYMVAWEEHQRQPQDRSKILELRSLLSGLRSIDAQQKQLVQQLRYKRLYERQQGDCQASSLPTSPQASSLCSSPQASSPCSSASTELR